MKEARKRPWKRMILRTAFYLAVFSPFVVSARGAFFIVGCQSLKHDRFAIADVCFTLATFLPGAFERANAMHATLLANRGYARWRLADSAASLKDFTLATEIYSVRIESLSETEITSYNNALFYCGLLHYEQGRFAEAELSLRQALAFADSLSAPDNRIRVATIYYLTLCEEKS